jgi:uncharacterized protein (UPF0332 family)
MKESSWKECFETNSAREVSPNLERSVSLIKIAEKRLKVILEINEENCNFVFEDYYTSILELLQALVIKNGFNVLNHICIGYYLRDVVERKDLYAVFNDLRYKRNSLTYYGNQMEFSIAKESINDAKFLINELSLLIRGV